MTTATTRLNKFIAHHSGVSRREADAMISSGRVRVNEEIAVLGGQVSDTDIVLVDGRPLSRKADYTYILLNKPVGYVCSRKRQGDTPTIFELLPAELTKLKPVGRLDKDSSGLILLTDDGDFAHRMTHPKFQKSKTYIVTLDKILEPLHQQMISDYGVTLEDGKSKFIVTSIEPPTYQVDMSEGRNRQIRRTFATLGYNVDKLHRTNFGNYSLGDAAISSYHTVDVR